MANIKEKIEEKFHHKKEEPKPHVATAGEPGYGTGAAPGEPGYGTGVGTGTGAAPGEPGYGTHKEGPVQKAKNKVKGKADGGDSSSSSESDGEGGRRKKKGGLL